MAKEKKDINEYHLNRDQPGQPQFAIHNLSNYLKEHQGDTRHPHIHSFYQIIWFKSGSGKHFVDFKAYDVLKDALFFIAKNQVHYFDQNTQYTGVLIHFNETFLAQNDNETDFFLKGNIFNNPYQQPFCSVDDGMCSILETYLKLISGELNREEIFGREELLRTYLKAFLIQVQRVKNKFDKDADKRSFVPDDKKIQLVKFIDLIELHYTKGLSVSEYAGLLHVSPRTLSDLTRQTLNKTPSQLIQERIVLEAQRLLLHSSLNVNQIGYRLGFDDASYFVKYFKKYTGTAPLEFRKSIFFADQGR
ncbi:MAG: helix-turn-helix domain-containing protein [Niabella sp.]|nr:helix-turn-helix domain-containing protein [Niabella sp.]